MEETKKKRENLSRIAQGMKWKQYARKQQVYLDLGDEYTTLSKEHKELEVCTVFVWDEYTVLSK